jgi:hypothetical protein
MAICSVKVMGFSRDCPKEKPMETDWEIYSDSSMDWLTEKRKDSLMETQMDWVMATHLAIHWETLKVKLMGF